MINKHSKIFITGHKGLVGSAILRKLRKKNYKKIITISRKNLDLLDQKAVHSFLKKKKPNRTRIVSELYQKFIRN